LLKGSGDCTAIDWTFLSLSIANWSFLNFILLALVSALIVRYRWR
jgi:protein dithiol:quinone oxidoreductase